MSARLPVVVGNWKMHLSLDEAVTLARDVAERAPGGVEVGVAPSAPYLGAVAQALRGSRVGLSAQDTHWEAAGAFTGEASPAQLKGVGCRYVIIGHSERRQLFGETDAGVAKKARAAHDHGLTPILCVGETLAEREAGRTLAVTLGQLDAAFSALRPEEAAASICAYEPVWAIGTGRTATPEQAQEVHRAIRARLAERFGAGVAAQVRLQYGGSVKADNAAALMAQPDIDGALVGGASLKAAGFLDILRAASQGTRLP